jgi:hypothetical protein
MPENIDPTWLAWALDEPPAPDRIAAALDRVERHYARLVDYPLERRVRQEGPLGVAVIGDAEPRCRWPHFSEDPEIAIVTAYAPTGWEPLCGESDPRRAPLPLARALLARPRDAAEALNAPAVTAVLDRRPARLLVLGDAIGAGRLYELRFAGGSAWSNRAGALPLFTGLVPTADERGWRLLAAASWALADSTPLAGVRKAGAGALIEATPDGVRRAGADGPSALVRGGDRLGALAGEAAERARMQALAAGRLWKQGAEVDLSGGRDSRVVAAAAIAAGIDARFHTSDVNPGEAEVARRLVAAAPRPLEHEVKRGSEREVKPREAPLLERARNVHLVHDGLRHPQKLRGEMAMPRRRPEGATLSGHGGEIAHGFFYGTHRQARRLRRGGDEALVERVLRFFAKGLGAARPEAYEEAQGAVRATLARGRDLGLDGPVLLDWFYLVDRFAHRSGVGAHAERISVFTVPAFVRAAFSLTPRQRVGARLHAAMIEALVPEWSAIPFYEAEAAAMPKVRRLRLWESPDDAAAIESLLAGGGSWEELYDADRVRAAWRELRDGGGKAKWEAAFEGIAYRAAFDDYLAVLAAAAGEGEPLARA